MTRPELIERLIEETTRVPDWRSDYARPGRLPVFNLWGPVMYLTPACDVVIDHEEDSPLRPADPNERDFALARAAELHPELAHLRPSMPQNAATCGLCCGLGRITISQETILPRRDGPTPESFVYCPSCNSLGWTVTG
jgi:hypothetical protein